MNASKKNPTPFPLEGGVYTDTGDGLKRVSKVPEEMPGKSDVPDKAVKNDEKVEVAKADPTAKPR